MKGHIYLTKEYDSLGIELKHDGLAMIGIGKTIDKFRRFLEHHNKGSKSTTQLKFIEEFEVDNMDFVESRIHKILNSLGYKMVQRQSSYGDKIVTSKTEVFSGRHIDTGEEISVNLIIEILHSILSNEEFIKITRKEFIPHFLQEIAILQCLDAIENENQNSVNIIAELCARFGKTLMYLELFRRLENDIMIIPSYVHSVFTSFENEIIGKYKDEKIGKWTNFDGFKIIDTTKNENWETKFLENYGKCKLIVFVSAQTREDSFSKFVLIKNIPSERKFFVIDEADFGAWTENSQKVVDYIS